MTHFAYIVTTAMAGRFIPMSPLTSRIEAVRSARRGRAALERAVEMTGILASILDVRIGGETFRMMRARMTGG
jgi:hypothetical protein